MAATGGPNGLQTATDLSLDGLDKGPTLEAKAAGEMRKRGEATGQRGTLKPQPTADLDLTWDDLKQRHPEYQAAFWEECRALYAGGARLLCNPLLMARLFPSNLYEDPKIYSERCKRAHYFPYAGTILDHLVAGLSSDPLRVSWSVEDEDGKATIDPSAEWWEQWVGDVKNEAETLEGAPGTEPDEGSDADAERDENSEAEGGCSAHEFMLEVAREAEQTRTAWILCRLPEADPDMEPTSALDEERAGLNDPYLCLCPAEHVIDWQEDQRKELEWVLVRDERSVRPTLRSRRNTIEQTYTIWTRTEWLRYVVIFDPKAPPADDTTIRVTAQGTHPFGSVPFVRFTLPEGMWGMGKLHSLAREHFNKRCAMAWAEFRALFPILYEFMGSEDSAGMPIAQIQQDTSRATSQVRSQGYSQLRGKDDRAEFVGPDAAAFTSAREGCNDLMREMHRVMFSMGLSANMDSAALGRSGDSKAEDKAATEVLLDALGTLIRGCFRRCMALVATARGERVPDYNMSGLDHFDAQGVIDALTEATLLVALGGWKSALAAELYYSRLYAKILGDGITQEQRETIREQVQENLSAEEMLTTAMNAAAVAAGSTDPNAQGGDKPEPDDGSNGPPTSKPKGGPMFRSRK